MNQQAVLWKTDCDKFNDFSNNRDNEKAGIMSEYKSNLQEQINYRKNAEKKWKCDMNPNERMMNKELLEKIDGIDLTDIPHHNQLDIDDEF